MVEKSVVAQIPTRLVGRPFGQPALEELREQLRLAEGCNRAEIARRVCRRLGWTTRSGRWALMSARVALLRLQARGLIDLPPPSNGNGNRRRYRPNGQLPTAEPILNWEGLQPLVWHLVTDREQSSLWNSLIERYHYLGHENLPGAQMRYLIRAKDGRLLAAVGFSAAAWHLACRDQWIGWNSEQRRSLLDLVLNNARFLILPWVRVANLASYILGQSIRRLPSDFQKRYDWRPVLLETFVDVRYAGHCYRAANWICLGKTQGRGKKGGHKVDGKTPVSIKQVWVYPLLPDFRRQLCVDRKQPDGKLD